MRLSHSAIEISRTSQQSPDPEHLFTMEHEWRSSSGPNSNFGLSNVCGLLLFLAGLAEFQRTVQEAVRLIIIIKHT